MLLYTSLLERDLKGQNENLKWVKKISSGVQTLDSVVNDILAFTQDQICNKVEVNVAAVLGETVDYLRPQIDTHDVEIDMSEVNRDITARLDINMFSN